ncbi:zinc knuckle CX2CX4HX4C containing protein [Tanacetum coccineum]
MLHQGFFMFQFSSKEGMDSIMKNGPWQIRSIPLLLNVWNANSQPKKEDIKRVPVWVKMFNVPIIAYSEIGLSLITSKLGRPIMLDAHTSSMCLNSWGLSSFARALVEISADNDFVESLVVVIPREKGKEHIMLRSNLDKLMKEEKVLDINTDEGLDNIGSIWERFKEVKKASTSDMKDESDEDEVYMPDDDV